MVDTSQCDSSASASPHPGAALAARPISMFVALTLLAPRAPAPACIVMSGKADPLRPQQPPLEPMIINAIQDLLRGKEPDAVVERAVQVPHHANTHLRLTEQAPPARSLSCEHASRAGPQRRPGLRAP